MFATNWRQKAYNQIYPVTTRETAGIVYKAKATCVSLLLSSDFRTAQHGLCSESSVLVTLLTHCYFSYSYKCTYVLYSCILLHVILFELLLFNKHMKLT